MADDRRLSVSSLMSDLETGSVYTTASQGAPQQQQQTTKRPLTQQELAAMDRQPIYPQVTKTLVPMLVSQNGIIPEFQNWQQLKQWLSVNPQQRVSMTNLLMMQANQFHHQLRVRQQQQEAQAQAQAQANNTTQISGPNPQIQRQQPQQPQLTPQPSSSQTPQVPQNVNQPPAVMPGPQIRPVTDQDIQKIRQANPKVQSMSDDQIRSFITTRQRMQQQQIAQWTAKRDTQQPLQQQHQLQLVQMSEGQVQLPSTQHLDQSQALNWNEEHNREREDPGMQNVGDAGSGQERLHANTQHQSQMKAQEALKPISQTTTTPGVDHDSGFTLPTALLAQYPALQPYIDWSNVQGSVDDPSKSSNRDDSSAERSRSVAPSPVGASNQYSTFEPTNQSNSQGRDMSNENMQPMNPQNASIQLQRYILQTLQAEGPWTGWQAEVPIQERDMQIKQLVDSLRLLGPPIDLQRAVKVALNFERKEFAAQPTKEDYQRECARILDKIKNYGQGRLRQQLMSSGQTLQTANADYQEQLRLLEQQGRKRQLATVLANQRRQDQTTQQVQQGQAQSPSAQQLNQDQDQIRSRNRSRGRASIGNGRNRQTQPTSLQDSHETSQSNSKQSVKPLSSLPSVDSEQKSPPTLPSFKEKFEYTDMEFAQLKNPQNQRLGPSTGTRDSHPSNNTSDFEAWDIEWEFDWSNWDHFFNEFDWSNWGRPINEADHTHTVPSVGFDSVGQQPSQRQGPETPKLTRPSGYGREQQPVERTDNQIANLQQARLGEPTFEGLTVQQIQRLKQEEVIRDMQAESPYQQWSSFNRTQNSTQRHQPQQQISNPAMLTLKELVSSEPGHAPSHPSQSLHGRYLYSDPATNYLRQPSDPPDFPAHLISMDSPKTIQTSGSPAQRADPGPVVPQDLWEMPMTIEGDWGDLDPSDLFSFA